jgi:hypothetical protein
MIRQTLLLLTAVCVAHAADSNRIRYVDLSVLESIPLRRQAALTLFATTNADGSPGVYDKKAKYIGTLKDMIQELMTSYYWHPLFPKGIDEAIEKRAVYQAGLCYPASQWTGCSFYDALIQGYTIRMYEEQIVEIARAVSVRFGEPDIAVVAGHAQAFETWKKAWDEAGTVKDGPNQPWNPRVAAALGEKGDY